KQEQGHWGDELGPLALDVTARQLPRLCRKQRQGVPDLPVEVQRAVQDVMHDRADRAVDVGLLTATAAIGSGQGLAAVEASPFTVLTALAGLGLDRAGIEPAFDCPADRFAHFAHLDSRR